MPSPKIAIGITTYKDIWTPEFGANFHELLASQPVSLAPTKARIWGIPRPIYGPADFSSAWRSETTFERREGRSKSSPVLERGHFRDKVEWSRDRTVKSRGEFIPHPETDPRGANAVLFRCHVNWQVDWTVFFEALVDLFEPSFAMLDLFEINLSGAEIGSTGSYDAVACYTDAFTDEYWFTRSRTVTGATTQPDSFDVVGRRTYRHLPELPWLSCLGREFENQFSTALAKDLLFQVQQRGEKTIIQLSADMRDEAGIAVARNRARAVFREGFFRCSPRAAPESATYSG